MTGAGKPWWLEYRKENQPSAYPMHADQGQSGPMARRATGQADTLDEGQLRRVLDYLDQYSRQPEADQLKILLSFRAGLRVSEIAAIEMRALVDSDGRVRPHIELHGGWTKSRKQRVIPMHSDITRAVKKFCKRFPEATHVAVRISSRGLRRQSANTLAVWFRRALHKVGLTGCSSHSGRRTFITQLAREANLHGASLRDVQRLAGHTRLDTTERYIQPAENLSSLINSLGERPM